MQRGIRIGKVSKVIYEKGMIRATYKDMDESVTAEIPYFSFTDEYKMPNVGDMVFVLHLSNGPAAAIALGRFWNEVNLCLHPGKGIFRKEFAPSDKFGKCWLEYDDDAEKMILHVPKKLEIVVEDGEGECMVQAKTLTLITDNTTNTGLYTGVKDVIGEGTSLHNHTHAGVHGETAPPS